MDPEPQRETTPDPKLVATLMALLPEELRLPGYSQEEIELGEQYLSLLMNINAVPDIPGPRSSEESKRNPFAWITADELESLRKIFSRGEPGLEYPTYTRSRQPYVRYGPASDIFMSSALVYARRSAEADDSAGVAENFILALRIADWKANRDIHSMTIRIEHLIMRLQAFANDRKIDVAGWRRILAAVAPIPFPNPRIREEVLRQTTLGIRHIASLKPKQTVLLGARGAIRVTIRPCGTIDHEETAREFITIHQLTLADAARPRRERKNDAGKAASQHVVGLYLPPEPTVYTEDKRHREIRNPNFEQEAEVYAQRMDEGHNTIGRWFLARHGAGYNHASFYVYAAGREMLRAFAATQIYRLEKGEMPSGWQDLVNAGILSEPPYDHLGDAPLGFDAESKKMWSTGLDGTDGGGARNMAPNPLQPSPPFMASADWVIQMPEDV